MATAKTPRLKEKYNKEVKNQLKEELGLENIRSEERRVGKECGS